jgi:ABC-2 type transport system permease protein
MLGLLLKNKFNIFLLGFTREEKKKRTGRIIRIIICAVIFFLIFYYSSKLFSFVYSSFDEELANTIIAIALDYMFAIVFIFILFTGVATSLYILYQSGDLELLLSLPISYRTVFAYKYIEALISNSYLFFIILFPFLLAYGATSKIPVAYYPVMLIVFISVVSLPTNFGVLIGMLAARYINPARAREMLAVVGGLLGFLVWLASQILPRYVGNLVPDLKAMGSESIQQYIINTFDKSFLKMLPSTAGSNALSSFHNGDYGKFALNFILISFISVTIMALCIMLSQSLYYAGWSGASQMTAGKKRFKKSKVRKEEISGKKYRLSLFSGVNYIVVKDLKLLIRDTRKLIQIIMPAIMFVFIFILSMSPGDIEAGSEIDFFIDIKTLLFLFVPLLVSGVINTAVSGNSIGSEELNFWILKAAPLYPKDILKAKIIYGSFVSAAIGCIFMLVPFFYLKVQVLIFVMGLILMILFSWGDSVICTFIGALFPVFEPSQLNKNNISFLGSILSFLFFVIYLLIFSGIVIGVLFTADYFNWQNFTAFAVIIVIETVINLIIHNILINIGAARLNSIEWKY